MDTYDMDYVNRKMDEINDEGESLNDIDNQFDPEYSPKEDHLSSSVSPLSPIREGINLVWFL